MHNVNCWMSHWVCQPFYCWLKNKLWLLTSDRFKVPYWPTVVKLFYSARNRDTAVPAEGNGNLQTLICVLVARPRRCLTLSNPVPWQNWMLAYLGYTLRMRTLFRGWPIMVNDTHTRRRRLCTYVRWDCIWRFGTQMDKFWMLMLNSSTVFLWPIWLFTVADMVFSRDARICICG